MFCFVYLRGFQFVFWFQINLRQTTNNFSSSYFHGKGRNSVRSIRVSITPRQLFSEFKLKFSTFLKKTFKKIVLKVLVKAKQILGRGELNIWHAGISRSPYSNNFQCKKIFQKRNFYGHFSSSKLWDISTATKWFFQDPYKTAQQLFWSFLHQCTQWAWFNLLRRSAFDACERSKMSSRSILTIIKLLITWRWC